MADTITIGPNAIQIIPNAGGISSFDIATYFPNGIRCSAINFIGSAASDVLKVRSKTSSGSFLVPSMKGSMDQVDFNTPIDCFPYILSTDLTLGTPANCIITIYYV